MRASSRNTKDERDVFVESRTCHPGQSSLPPAHVARLLRRGLRRRRLRLDRRSSANPVPSQSTSTGDSTTEHKQHTWRRNNMTSSDNSDLTPKNGDRNNKAHGEEGVLRLEQHMYHRKQ